MTNDLVPFLAPKGVALIGTSADPSKLSHGIIRNMIETGFKGKVYPINPRYKEILGLTCYPDVASVPDPVDLAVVVLPAPSVLEVLEACGKRGIKAVNIISGGFKEVGPEGAALEQKCLAVAHQYGMRLIGPNCVGTMDLYSGLNTTFIKGVPDIGHIGFVSQSGAVCGAVVDYVRGKGIGFSNFTSLGNEADVTETDMIEYLASDPNTHVICCYVEAIRDGVRFREVASRVAQQKPIIMLKVGRTSAGARAVSSHTGSLAGSNAAYEAAFKQSGVLTVNSAAELFDLAIALVHQPLPKGSRTVIITNAGGPAALASDSLAMHGMSMGDISQPTKEALRKVLVPSAQVNNPVDMLGGAEPHEYADALNLVLADPDVDAAIPVLVPQALVNPVDVAKVIGEAASKTDKTVVACFMGGVSVESARQVLHDSHVPMYIFPEAAGQVLGAMYHLAQLRSQPQEAPVKPQNISTPNAQKGFELAGQEKNLGEAHTRPLLQAYGVPIVPGDWAHSENEAVTIAEKIGYPVALKIVSPDILHKSEVGGIKLNLASAQDVQKAYQALMQTIGTSHPTARLEGVLVEKMSAKGHEIIVGMKRDPSFGPLMMFGLGGIYVELLTDIAFRVAPLTRQDAYNMIAETKAGKLLSGLRNQPAADIDAVVDIILRLNQLALDFPQIDEMEINPLIVFNKGQGALALDARALLK
jgi:acetyltransferase